MKQARPGSVATCLAASAMAELEMYIGQGQDNLNVCMSFSSICKYSQVLTSRSHAFSMRSQENVKRSRNPFALFVMDSQRCKKCKLHFQITVDALRVDASV